MKQVLEQIMRAAGYKPVVPNNEIMCEGYITHCFGSGYDHVADYHEEAWVGIRPGLRIWFLTDNICNERAFDSRMKRAYNKTRLKPRMVKHVTTHFTSAVTEYYYVIEGLDVEVIPG